MEAAITNIQDRMESRNIRHLQLLLYISKTSAKVLLVLIYSYVFLIVLLPFVCSPYLLTPLRMYGLIHIFIFPS